MELKSIISALETSREYTLRYTSDQNYFYDIKPTPEFIRFFSNYGIGIKREDTYHVPGRGTFDYETAISEMSHRDDGISEIVTIFTLEDGRKFERNKADAYKNMRYYKKMINLKGRFVDLSFIGNYLKGYKAGIILLSLFSFFWVFYLIIAMNDAERTGVAMTATQIGLYEGLFIGAIVLIIFLCIMRSRFRKKMELLLFRNFE